MGNGSPVTPHIPFPKVVTACVRVYDCVSLPYFLLPASLLAHDGRFTEVTQVQELQRVVAHADAVASPQSRPAIFRRHRSYLQRLRFLIYAGRTWELLCHLWPTGFQDASPDNQYQPEEPPRRIHKCASQEQNYHAGEGIRCNVGCLLCRMCELNRADKPATRRVTIGRNV